MAGGGMGGKALEGKYKEIKGECQMKRKDTQESVMGMKKMK